VKTTETVKVHEALGTAHGRYLKSVVAGMSQDEQEIFEGSRGHHCIGEIALFDILTQDGIDRMIAAQAAVSFPNPLKFHPAVEVFSLRDAKDIYEAERARGADPLDALVKAAHGATPYDISTTEYQQRHNEFAKFIASQKQFLL